MLCTLFGFIELAIDVVVTGEHKARSAIGWSNFDRLAQLRFGFGSVDSSALETCRIPYGPAANCRLPKSLSCKVLRPCQVPCWRCEI